MSSALLVDERPVPDGRYYASFAAAYVRAVAGHEVPAGASDDDAIVFAQQRGLDLHTFKRSAVLPRVRRVLGLLRALAPASLLDVGSGRGAFLWPLLAAFPALPVMASDTDTRRVSVMEAVARGGVERLCARRTDVTHLDLPDDAVDGVTILEVLEHLADPARAAREVLRVARRFVIASVPSRPDNNPEHVRCFTRQTLTSLFLEAGAKRVSVEYVLNHVIALALIGRARGNGSSDRAPAV